MENKIMLSLDQLSSVTGGAGQGEGRIEYYIEHDCEIIAGPFYTQNDVNYQLQWYKDNTDMKGLGVITKYPNQ